MVIYISGYRLMVKAAAERALPKTLGACVDLLYTTRQARLAKQGEAEEMRKLESRLSDHLIETLPKSDASGVSGKLARATIQTKKVPSVTDWDTFYKYVLKTKDFSLLQRRVAENAVKERWDDGKTVPGVDVFNAVTVSLNKV